MWADLTNALFECGGAVAIFANCVALYRARQVRGVNLMSVAFFTAWGFWNLYYYPSLNQWLSFTGGLLIVLFNCVWLSMAWKFRKQ